MAHRSDIAAEAQQPRTASRAAKKPRPADSRALPGHHVTFHPDRTGGLLFDRLGQRIFHADLAAAFVWCSLAESRTTDDIAMEFAQRAGITPDQAEAHIDSLLNDWSVCGLLAESVIPAENTGSVLSHDPPPLPAANKSRFVVTCRLLDTAIAIRFADSRLHGSAAPLLGTMTAPLPPDRCRILHVARSHSGTVSIFSDSELFYRGRSETSVAAAVLASLTRLSLRHCGYFPAIHAGFVSGPDGAVLLPGPSGQGKSTLVAGLWSAGLSALSDDTVVLDRRDMTARPVNPYVCLKSGSWSVLQSRIPDLARLPRFRRPDGHHVRYLFPGRARGWDHASSGTESVAVRAVIFGHYRRREPSVFSSLSTAEALTRLLPCIDPIGRRFTPVDIDRLVDWIDGIERYELVYGQLDEAIEIVRQVTG